MKRLGLEIFLTSNCNFSCSFCLYKKGRKESIDIKESLFLKKVDSQLTAKKYDAVWLTGGEPLLVLPKVKSVIELIKKRNPKTPIKLFTNGSLLTSEIISFLNKNNITVVISFDGVKNGDKTLNRLKTYIDTKKIKQVNRLIIKYIWDIEKSFYKDLKELKMSFSPEKQAAVLLGCDYTGLENFSDTRLKVLKKDIYKLEDYFGDITWLIPYNFTSKPCKSGRDILMSDGNIYTLYDILPTCKNTTGKRGCHHVRTKMGCLLYDKFLKFFQEKKMLRSC